MVSRFGAYNSRSEDGHYVDDSSDTITSVAHEKSNVRAIDKEDNDINGRKIASLLCISCSLLERCTRLVAACFPATSFTTSSTSVLADRLPLTAVLC